MPTYLGPADTLDPRPWQAYNPGRAWFPVDFGPRLKEFVRGDDATLTGSCSWGTGSYGRSLVTSGGNALTAGLGGGLPAGPLSITIAHYRPPDAPGSFPDLIGWGDGVNGQYGIGYQPGFFGLTNFSGVPINQVALGYPTGAWRIITVTFAGLTNGSAIEYWADGARIYAGSLGADFPAPSRFRIGAANNGNLAWRGHIGPTYAHPRVLSGREIRDIHSDPNLFFRDFRSRLPRLVAKVPVPITLAAAGIAPEAQGAATLDWGLSIDAEGIAPAAEGSGSLAWGLTLAAAGIAPAAKASGSMGWTLPPKVALLPAAPGLEGLPAGPQERAYAIACEVLRTDPALRSIGAAQRLVAYNGTDPRSPVPGAPGYIGLEGFMALASKAVLPLIRVYPEDWPSDWRQEISHDASFPIRIELAVEGERADGLLRLWYAVIRAFWPLNDGSPKSNARLKALSDIVRRHQDPVHGAIDFAAWQIEQHASGIFVGKGNGPYTIGAGSIRVNLMVETP